MTLAPSCILYSQESELARRIKAYLRPITLIRHVAEADRLEAVLEQSGSSLLFIDLRAKDARDISDQVQRDWPHTLIIALGTPRSEPLREADQSDIYAAEDLQLERRRFQALAGRAFDHLRLQEENRVLREGHSSELVQLERAELAPVRSADPSLPLLRFPRVFRRFDNVETVLSSIVESVADAVGVGRVGIFARGRSGDRYRLRAGLRCLPETYEIEYRERDPLVRWLELHAHLISRGNLAQAGDQIQRALMRRALDTCGAEVIVPLHARGRIIGWLFFGSRLTGQPFAYGDLENLMLLAEHVSTLLENSLLHEEVTAQKNLAVTLLNSIPPGIIAIDDHAIIRWLSPTAEQLLGLKADHLLHQPVEAAGSRLAAFLRDAMESDDLLPSQQWVDPSTHRSLAVEARRVREANSSLGAVAVLQDLTAAENLRDKQDLLERAAFWSDLAASMSHEIRNPLVAIKTFAQLLPERFDDADFRKEFNEIVVQEIDRLDRIITQINNFAHPTALVMKSFDLRESVKRAVEIARERSHLNGTAVETDIPHDLPPLQGDEKALTDAFAHLVANAAEATDGLSAPLITLAAKPVTDGLARPSVMVTIHDNGRGIDPELKDKIFSPFCTTKARGMGLGLPIAKRTVFDHNGRLDIDSNPRGTSVSVILPSVGPNGG